MNAKEAREQADNYNSAQHTEQLNKVNSRIEEAVSKNGHYSTKIFFPLSIKVQEHLESNGFSVEICSSGNNELATVITW